MRLSMIQSRAELISLELTNIFVTCFVAAAGNNFGDHDVAHLAVGIQVRGLN